MTYLQNPLFWAFISLIALSGSIGVLTSKKIGQNPLFGIIITIVFDFGRIYLATPGCPQPRFDSVELSVVGGFLFVIGLIFCTPVFTIHAFTRPASGMKLNKSGFYRLTRNPIHFGEILWFLGWAMINRSIIGIALVPFWWFSLLMLTLVEENILEQELGDSYLEYKRQVQSRIIPGLPI